MTEKSTILKLDHISKHYDSVSGTTQIDILRDVSLTVIVGESIAITGPSGSGKSTLLNLMGALDRPSSGRIMLQDADLATLDEKSLAWIRNRKIGFVFQQHHLLPQCTVLENVLVPALPGKKVAQAEERASRLLERVGLQDRIDHKPAHLSGGECQRVAVVRALINDPLLLLADEPTGSLDRRSAMDIIQLLVQLNRENNLAMILVTHSIEIARFMGRHFELFDGGLTETHIA
jgi:ABC-type lipoprotein export system ATPase subunit